MSQTDLYLTIRVPKPGQYVLVIQYHSPITDRSQDLTVDVITDDTQSTGDVYLPGKGA